MTTEEIIEEIKLTLTGGVLELEIDDKTIATIIKKALRELERYWDETTLVTVPYSSCIDLSGFNSSSITKVYRTAYNGSTDNEENTFMDPVYAQQWMIFSNGGTMYNLQDYMLNLAAWNTSSQIRNTMSTDMAFKEDKHNNKLYINCYLERPSMITIEYVPKLTDPDEVKSDYWIDILVRLSLALTKITLGRIRTRFTQSSALWTQDGEKLLEEGNTEFKELQEVLRVNSMLIYPID